MEVKHGYKQTEVGVIPEDWEVVLLDTVAKRGSGHTPDKAHPEYWGGNIKWISLQDTGRLDRRFIYDTAVKITSAGISNSSARMHPKGTVVLSRDAGVGKSAIMKCDMAVSQHFMAWTCGIRLANTFLYYWLQSAKPEFERIAMGNTIKTIGLPYFRQLVIPLPTKAEQEAIATALSDADAWIESLEQLIAKKRQIKQGAMQELLTGKRRLPGFEVKRGYKQTEVGVIPEDWEVPRVGDVCGCIVPGRNKPTLFDGDVPWITTPDLEDGKPVTTSRLGLCVSRAEAKMVGSKVVPPGSVLMSCAGELGIVAKNKCEIVVNQQLHVFLPTERIDGTFLLYALSYRSVHIAGLGTKTAVPYLNKRSCNSIPIPLPPLPEQRAIATALSDAETEIAMLKTKLTKAGQIKQGMMQELLTGKIRLI